MIEWVLVVAPVAFSILVFGLALGTDPIDVSFERVTIPTTIEDRGYAELAIYGLLQRKIGEIVEVAGSARAPERIEVGTPDTAVNAYAEIVNVERPVRATQRLLRLVRYVAEVHFVAGDDKQITAVLRIRDSNTLKLLKFERIQGETDHIEALLDRIAKSTVGLLDSYILAAFMYQNAVDEEDFRDLVDYAERMIPVIAPDLLPWFYNLLGLVAMRSGDPDLAIAYYQEAIGLDGTFYLAYINWGRALAEQGRQGEAIELYRAALAIDAHVPVAHVYLAEALTSQQHVDEALAELAEAETLAPEFAGIYSARAAVLEQLQMPLLAHGARLRARTSLLRQPRQNLYDTL